MKKKKKKLFPENDSFLLEVKIHTNGETK